MEFLLQLIILFTFWLPILMGAVFFVVLLIVYAFKASEFEDEFLKSLDDDTRLLYAKCKLNAKMPFSAIFKRKAVDHNEDK